MKKQLVMGLIVASMASTGADAAEKKLNSPENIGFGSGLVAGAAIGGPLGGMIGALGGILLGNSITTEKTIAELQASLAENENALAAERASRITLEKRNYQLAASIEKSRLELAMNVQFRTGSSELEPLYQQSLENIVALLKKDSSLQVTLSGYADRRGDEAFNEQLSAQRVAAVQQVFRDAGIHLNRIKTREFGERSPVDSTVSIDGHAFDRRVAIEVSGSTSVIVNR
jgi:sortase system peptidoglycan-associated protein